MRVSVEDDARFEREYKQSNRAVAAVAEHLKLSGNEVQVIAALDFFPREQYQDKGGDLLARRAGSQSSFKLIEVKWRSFDFTDLADFPFPSIILDRIKPGELPALYVSVNKTLTVAAFVPISTRAYWYVNEVTDFKRGYGPSPRRLCPTVHAKFVQLRRLS